MAEEHSLSDATRQGWGAQVQLSCPSSQTLFCWGQSCGAWHRTRVRAI